MNNNVQLTPGTLLQNGKYKIIRVLGQGGFGITYEAEQTMMKVRFAIKEFFVNINSAYCRRDTTYSNVVVPNFDDELYKKLRQSFLDEARTLHKLDHIPNVVKVRDTFEENDTVYFVMDFVEGQSLGSKIKNQGTLYEQQVKKYSIQILNALKEIHKEGILHRDIKPDNIIIKPDDTAVLIDFGIARNFIDDKTQFHTAFVSKGFAPPEQEAAKARKGAYSDLYSVGATMYYCLTKVVPQTVSELSFEEYHSAKTHNNKISNETNSLIDKAISKKREDRFQSCEEFLLALNGNKKSEGNNEATKIDNSQGNTFNSVELQFLSYFNKRDWESAYKYVYRIRNPKLQYAVDKVNKIINAKNNPSEERFFKSNVRIGRGDFAFRNIILSFVFVIFELCIILFLNKVSGFSEEESTLMTLTFTSPLIIIYFILFFINLIKRIKDTNSSPWLSILAIIPYIGNFYVLALYFVKGTDGANKYGIYPYKHLPFWSKINKIHAWISLSLAGLSFLLFLSIFISQPVDEATISDYDDYDYATEAVEAAVETDSVAVNYDEYAPIEGAADAAVEAAH